jgi:hypothetical protein
MFSSPNVDEERRNEAPSWREKKRERKRERERERSESGNKMRLLSEAGW